MSNIDLNVILMHEHMVNKEGSLVTTSVTLIDIHDIARSCTTYGVTNFYVAHPSVVMRKLGRTIKDHWSEGSGAIYNPNRKEAIDGVIMVSSLDEAIQNIDLRTGKLPTLIATSAKNGPGRVKFKDFRNSLQSGEPYLLMLGTGWGMSNILLDRANLFLEPINGPTPYNHLSVRAACAIMLDRILAPQ
jgi:hypothetical protein